MKSRIAVAVVAVVLAVLTYLSPGLRAQPIPPTSGTPADNARAAVASTAQAVETLAAAVEAAETRALAAEAAADAARFAPWPSTATYFGAISNTADGDAEKALPGELCTGHNISNRTGVTGPDGMERPYLTDPAPLIVRWHNERESGKRTGRLRCRSGSLTTVYRRYAVPLAVPGEGDWIPLTRPTVAQYPHEPRDYVHPDDFPLIVHRLRSMYAGDEFAFLDNAGGHERHGFVYSWSQSLGLISQAAAAGHDIGCRLVFNVVLRPDLAAPGECTALAAAVTADHGVMFEWLGPLDACRPCLDAVLDAGAVVVLSGDPATCAAWVRTSYPAGARVYVCRSPFNSTAGYLAQFSR